MPPSTTKVRARDEGGVVRGQEDDRAGDFLGLAEAAHRNVDQAALALLFAVEVFHQQFGCVAGPGQRALTRMFSRAWITANSRVRARTPPLLAV